MPAPHAPAFEIWRESAGIPHIRAKSDAAAWGGLAACMSATGCARWTSGGAAPLAGWPNGPDPRRCLATASPAGRRRQALGGGARRSRALDRGADGAGETGRDGGGSNNWAVSGDLTDDREPILIGDPHRELEMPAMYAPAHAAEARFDSVGLTVPGGPGFPHVGHNAQVAWCVTHAMADIQDSSSSASRTAAGAPCARARGARPRSTKRSSACAGRTRPSASPFTAPATGRSSVAIPPGAAPSRWPRRCSPGASTASTACHGCCAPERRPSSTRRRAAGR